MVGVVEYNKFVKASTIIEVVVASVIFMLIFCISLEMLTKMNQDSKSAEALQIIMDCNEYVQQVKISNHGRGDYIKNFNWGEIHVKVQPYKNYNLLQEMCFTGKMKDGKRLFEYRFLIKNGTN